MTDDGVTLCATSDSRPYRANVGAVLFDRRGLVLVARRSDLPPEVANMQGWQLPQGGIDPDEDPRTAILRELQEEIGTGQAHIIGEHPEWLTYDFPPEFMALGGHKAKYRGQRQRWFALRFAGTDADIRLDADPHPEFNAWRWVTLDSLPGLAVSWKRPVYEALSVSFAGHAVPA